MRKNILHFIIMIIITLVFIVATYVSFPAPNWAQNDVFGHFMEIASLVFANFAYDDRQA